AQRRAEEEQASREQLRAIQRAFREALLALPAEEYDWFDVRAPGRRVNESEQDQANAPATAIGFDDVPVEGALALSEGGRQRQFFEFAGPLFSVAVSPAASTMRVGEERELRALPRDRARRRVEDDLVFSWEIIDGAGTLKGEHDQAVTFLAPEDPGLIRIKVAVVQRDVQCAAEALITVTRELIAQFAPTTLPSQGLPSYTFERAAGESWRSKYDTTRNMIVVNNGHRDFVYASRGKALKLRYLVRLYAKELVLRNFAGLPSDQLLERMVELSLRTEEHL
ncbi:MAG: hypothetical protein JO134_18955, partial [Xanthobacteraceae bacterium]|nr:hypothetical protein [Xanthobacteraceae bacterium]